MIDLSGLGDRADVPREFAAWQRLLDQAATRAGCPARSRGCAALGRPARTCCPPGTSPGRAEAQRGGTGRGRPSG